MSADKEMESSLQKRDNIRGKNDFLSWVGANDYDKDKIMGNYTIKLMGDDTKKPKPK